MVCTHQPDLLSACCSRLDELEGLNHKASVVRRPVWCRLLRLQVADNLSYLYVNLFSALVCTEIYISLGQSFVGYVSFNNMAQVGSMTRIQAEW